ncbi:hypothetical protein PR248_00885 [Metamycoplasma hyosynoviae]|nr:hypothetical protein [Metamycoplasma hyosynoviae]MDC8913603.1 hypothetical protein [Metamycoplasma hyosynoviae]
MNKSKLKKFLVFPALITPILPAVTLISRRAEEKPEKPKEVAKDFDTFEGIAKEEVKKRLKKVLEVAISYFQNESKRVNNDKKMDFKKRTAAIIYLENIIKFLNDNKDKIVEDYYKYDFHILQPHVLSKEKKLLVGDIFFNKKNYVQVKYGFTDPYNYEKVIKGEGNTIKKIEEIDNVITKEQLTKFIETYFVNLEKEIGKIIYNSEETPEIDKDIEVKPTPDGLQITKPKDFESWEAFVQSKIKNRFVDFDLRQKIEEEEPTPKPNEKPPEPPKPSIVPDKPTEKVETEQQIESLPWLTPIVSADYAHLSADNIKSEFESGKNVFFFDNPINTRYSYRVGKITSVNSGANTFKVVVSVQDRIDPSQQRSFPELEVKMEDNSNPLFQILRQEQINTLKNSFTSLYTALGIDDKLDYNNLGDSDIANVLFSMITAITTIYYNNSNFIYEVSLLLSKGLNSMEDQGIYDAGVVSPANQKVADKVAESIKALLIEPLVGSKLSGLPFWTFLPIVFENVLTEIKANVGKAKELLESNYNEFNFKLNVLDTLYRKASKDVFELKAFSTSKSLNYAKWFDSYVTKVAKAFASIQTLGKISLTKKINKSDSKKVEEIQNAYDKALGLAQQGNATQTKLQITFGALMLAIGLINTIAWAIITSLKYRKLTNKNIKKVFITIIIISVIVLIAGATLLGWGLKGI